MNLRGGMKTYEEQNVQIPAIAKLSVSNLKCDCHAVIFMKLFMKAFSRVRFELDRVSQGCTSPKQNGP
jgi:hypothetical protein